MTDKENLELFFEKYCGEDVAVAFSGGADSALVLYYALKAAKTKGKKVYAALIKTTLHPANEAMEAKKLAEDMGAEFIEIRVDEFANAGIENNPKDRCYLCKRYMFSTLKQRMLELGVKTVFEGTNIDDTKVYRPGIKAIKELNIISPLWACNIDKSTVRKELSDIGISVADKPSAPCLATRFPYDTKLTEENLRRVDKAEAFLKELGVKNVRVRVHEDLARIEVDREDEERILGGRELIIKEFTDLGYEYVTYDLCGFKSGSMDKKILKQGE